MLTAVIIEDERRSLDMLLALLAREFPHVRVLGTAADVPSGLALVARERPQVLFLDIELGDRTGFDLLEGLGQVRPHLIFTTAHEGYAVKAIRFSALDYLLKPVDTDELRSALAKALDAEQLPQRPAQFLALLKNLAGHADRSWRMAVPVSEGLEMVDLDQLICAESDGHYTTLRLIGKKRLTVARNIGQFEEILAGSCFIRVHHGHLVNMDHVVRYVKGEGGELVLTDGVLAPVSRRKKQDVLSILNASAHQP